MAMLRAERVDFQIAPGIFLEFYRLPDGEKRIGMTSAAIVCGHRREYFNKLHSSAPNHLKALKAKGFTGFTKEVIVGDRGDGIRGASRSLTFSLSDFRVFVRVSAFELDKKPAMSIAEALLGVAIETIAKQAFGEEALTLAEIRAIVCTEYAKTVNWLEEDREDAMAIAEHSMFLRRR
jgi:uncharacterized protein YqfB (UPF0267 family)